jgi:hypothetical protein
VKETTLHQWQSPFLACLNNEETQLESFLETVQPKTISRHNQKTDIMAQLVSNT